MGLVARALAFAVAATTLLGCGGRTTLTSPSARANADAGGVTSMKTTCDDTQSDESNCGACGVKCEGTCTGGRCLVTLASGQANVNCIAVNATDVYWMNAGADLEGTGSVRRVSIDGGPVATLASHQGSAWPCRMALDATHVYWTFAGGSAVLKLPLDGGTPVTLASGAGPDAIAVDATTVYFANEYGGTMKVPLGGGPAIMLDGSSGNALAIDATSVYVTARGAGNAGGSVTKVPLGGGGAETIASDQPDPESIATDSENVFWANYADGTIAKVSVTGGNVTTVATGGGNAEFVAVDASSVYWASDLGNLSKVSKQGGASTLLSAGRNIFDVVVDGTSVYWTDGESILKITPK